MYHALITRLAIRRSGWILLAALVLGGVSLPLAQVPIPGFDDWGNYSQHVLFSAIPLPMTVLAAVFLRRVAVDGEDSPGRQNAILHLAQCLIAPALLLPAMLIPAFGHPVNFALKLALAITVLITGVVMIVTPFLQWRLAWLPAAVVAGFISSLGVPTGQVDAQLLVNRLTTGAVFSIVVGVLVCSLVPVSRRELQNDS